MMTLLQDQEIMAALMDIQGNPANISKYMGNPKIMKALRLCKSFSCFLHRLQK